MTSSENFLNSEGVLSFLYSICAVSVLVNIVVLFVICWCRGLRASTDIFLANMTVSDILLAGIGMPLKLYNASRENFYGGDPVCKIVMFLPQFTIMSCISTMVAISFDRYNVIVKNTSMKSKRLVSTIIAIWILAIITSAPQIYEYKLYVKFEEEENETELVCGSKGTPEHFEMGYAIAVLFVSYLIPVSTIIICYGILVSFLWKRSKLLNAMGGSEPQGYVSKVKLKVLKMTVLVTAVFATFWLPYFIMFSIQEITDTDDIAEVTWLHKFKTILVVLSTISTPVLYVAFSTAFRKGMYALVTCAGRVTPTGTSTASTSQY